MSDVQKRKPGRPKDHSKREALLDAARQLFLTRGMDVTLEEIALTANVSKATIYSKVANKEELVEAVIRRESDLTVTDDELLQSESLPIGEALHAFGVRYLNFINRRELHGWDRLIASAATRDPDLPRKFFAAGPGRGQAILVKMIAHASGRGELEVSNATMAADNLAGLWLGFENLEVKLGAREPLSEREIDERVSLGITLFMRLYGPQNAICTDSN